MNLVFFTYFESSHQMYRATIFAWSPSVLSGTLTSCVDSFGGSGFCCVAVNKHSQLKFLATQPYTSVHHVCVIYNLSQNEVDNRTLSSKQTQNRYVDDSLNL